MKPFHILLTLALLFSLSFAQSGLGGVITDEQNKPLEAAHIINYKGKSHAHSNELGRFFITNTQVGDTLEINLLGFASRKIVATADMKIQLSEKQIRLDEVVIEQSLNPLNIVSDLDLLTRPVNSSQDLLRTVPGLIIGQHAGGGKAEQIFLRGFDIDHGTDIAINVDGMPVNMVSHAHGQGYADLHFLIPETIEQIDFGKGPYRADQGNFATAGHVNFKTKEDLESNLFQLEAGQFNTRRAVAMLEMLDSENHNFYTAMEYLGSDGPFESSQFFKRLNVMGKYTGRLTNEGRLSLSVSHFSSDWDASGQIPQRAVDQGFITRFGAIDDTEGGTTSRTNAVLQFDKAIADRTWLKNTMYYSNYQFELFSNFTFFLEDPENGDQIKQHESRNMFGFRSELNHQLDLGSASGLLQAGLGMRSDNSLDNYLARTANRTEILEYLQRGDIQENNLFAYANAAFDLGKFEINPGVRIDQFEYQYKDDLTLAYDPLSNNKAIVSPKLNVNFHASPNLQLYLNSGKGFHSNDTRVVLAQRNDILPAAWGSDLGFWWKAGKKLLINAAGWFLHLDQEFVYVGDAGIVEPGGRTRRMGLDLSGRYQVTDWLYGNADFTYTYARAIDEEVGQDFIPLAPDFTMIAGLNMLHPSGLYGGLNLRHIADRPANEDNSINAEGYTVTDMSLGFRWKRVDLGIDIQNLFDVAWNETQFATESRLMNEFEPVEEIHFTPGTPFFAKGRIRLRF